MRSGWPPGESGRQLAGHLRSDGLALQRPTRAVEFEIGPPQDSGFANPDSATAISPDGRWIVFRAQPTNTPATLWLRPLGSPVARSLAGTEGGDSPFWSPDTSHWRSSPIIS